MSFGSSAMRFEVKHGAKGGIFWQKDAPKQKHRKFGYKSKELRHAIRRPEPEYIEEPAHKTKPSTNFIKKNRAQFKSHRQEEEKENYRSSSNVGRPSSEIKPGTVTLTQDQLNALLATVGKLKPGEADGLRISIDADTNELKIDSPRGKTDSVPNSRGSDHGRPSSGDGDYGNIPGLGRNRDADDEDSTFKATNKRNAEKEVRFDSARNEVQQLKPEPETNPRPPLPPAALVPWTHMTVAERKRLQWAREKEAAEKLGDFDPWGRPGAGAPPPKKPEVHVPDAELHTKEEKNLRAAVDEIEAKYAALLSQTASRHSPAARTRNHSGDDVHSKPSRQPDPVSPAGDDAEIRSSQGSVSKHRLEDKGNSRPNRKQQNRTDEQKERRGAPRGIERKPRPSRDEGKGDNREGRDYRDRRQEDEETRKVVEAREEPGERTAPGSQGPASGQTSMMIGQSAPDNSQFISKKEEEKKKWLAELDRQREEKRLQKQRERDERRAGVDDTWADRFVQQPPPRPSIRMQQQQPTATQQLMAPDAAPTSGYRTESTVSGGRADSQNNEMPPPAMRSCMAIGGIAPNDDRIRDKKREEQRLWLEELNKQREEQREARMKLKDKTRASEETWADRFTHDPRETAAVDRSPRTEPPQTGSYHDNAGGRISSAPQPQPASTAPAADEDVTFIRGQNVYLDPVTRYELEQKRKKHLEYQAAVKAQIEEKERLKREERERKWREEMEEEAKLKAERDKLQRQLEAEENKHRQKEEARQRQVEQLKNMMDAEQERAKEQRMLNRLTTLQQGGHDIRGLKAHYEATTPRLHGVSVDPSTIPGLGGTSPRDNYHSNQRDNHYSNPPSYRGNMEAPSTKRSQEIATDTVSYDPYVEDRVLTPSRFRKPSQPHNDPSSPRREFATQTGDIAALIESLKKEISDVEIEYRPKPGDKASRNNNKQVHVKSTDNKKQPDNRQRQGAPQPPPTKQSKPKQQKADGKPPTWNYQNPKKKAPVKQSEKDPFFEQKRQEREEQRAKRERQLQYLVELNKQDPILNPGLVKDFPTARQDQILQQLSSLKQSLIQRQRELETCMSPSDFEKQV